jgi:hemoglobin
MFIQVETNATSLYDRVGGDPFFTKLVEHFYQGIEADPLLRPLYPANLDPPKRHLALFLAQYWGGPHTYNELRGHPRLRMRHLRFRIGQQERDAWLTHMRSAIAESAATPPDAAALVAYFETAATSLVNHPR